MERGPMALFGALVAVGLGPAMWLGAQFGQTAVTPLPAPVITVDADQGNAPGRAGAAIDDDGESTEVVDEHGTGRGIVPLSGTPSARPSTSSPTSVPPTTVPTTAVTTTPTSPAPEPSASSAAPSTPPTESTTTPPVTGEPSTDPTGEPTATATFAPPETEPGTPLQVGLSSGPVA